MKLLYVTPHTSTGGCPQVLLKRLELLKDEYDLYVIEYTHLSVSFKVQRDKIIELIGDNFFSLGYYADEVKKDVAPIIEEISPDVIHMEEIPELFMKKHDADFVYRKDRKYKIFETTHTSTFDVTKKDYFPDKFLFVSKFNIEQYESEDFGVPMELIEYPIDKLEVSKIYKEELGFEDDYFHILNVGLFTPGKNQALAFNMARKMLDFKVKFHFVGNLASNFSDYWQPLMEEIPENCVIWHERDDVYKFYQSSDLLLFTSEEELNPLVLKEAISYQLPIFMYNLNSYRGAYDNYKDVTFLTGIRPDVKKIFDTFNIFPKTDSNMFKQQMINEYGTVEEVEVEEVEFKKEENKELLLKYDVNFVDGASIILEGDKIDDLTVHFIDKKDNQILQTSKLKLNEKVSTDIKYFVDWKIVLRQGENIILKHEMELKGTDVLISMDSKSLGDNLAWIPYVEEFRKKHECNVYCKTFWNNLFENEYPDIIFVEADSIRKYHASYEFGWYIPWNKNLNPNNFIKIPLQQTASDILGLEFKEIVPKVYSPEGARPIEEKYVCIAEFSTTNSKHWHYPIKNSNKGWQTIVDWLNDQGYKVMVISKQATKLKNIIDKTGNFPIEHRINEIKHSEFFIGIGSGLSWLAWALGKKVVMISGFSDPICEFKSNNIRVHNFNVCNGCFNRHDFDRGDWDWCPDHKHTDRQFECTIKITPEMVADRILKSKLIELKKEFNFKKYTVSSKKLNSNDFKIDYNKNENKITLSYSGINEVSDLKIDVKDDNGEVRQTIYDVKLSKEFSLWFAPKDKLIDVTKKFFLEIYDEEILARLEYII